MRRLAVALPLAAAVAVASGKAAAADRGPVSIEVRAGSAVPQADAWRNWNTGVRTDLAIGYAFLPWLHGELGTGSLHLSAGPFSYLNGGVSESVEAMPITAAVRFVVPLSAVEPYATAGAGWWFYEFRREPQGSSSVTTRHVGAPGAFLGAGVAVPVGARVVLDAQARWFVSRPSVTWAEIGTGDFPLHEDRTLDSFEAVVGIAVRF